MGRIKVKISTNSPAWSFIRQTPGAQGVWGNYQFCIDNDVAECDWWVIIDGLVKEQTVSCPPSNTILITGEPPSIKNYEKNFIEQFGTVITTQTKIKAPRIVNLQLMPWYIGAHYNVEQKRFDAYSKGYNELKQIDRIPKTKMISIVSSNKTRTPGHQQRMKFISLLKSHFGEQLDVFGSGIQIIADKWDGIAPYKYHIAIENSVVKDYWTEKLADPFLAQAYPFYHGCPNIDEYFPQNSLTKIDIYRPDEAIAIIEKAIQHDYSHTFDSEVQEAKRLILDQYQIFPQLCTIMNKSSYGISAMRKVPITIKPEERAKKNILMRIGDKIARSYWKL